MAVGGISSSWDCTELSELFLWTDTSQQIDRFSKFKPRHTWDGGEGAGGESNSRQVAVQSCFQHQSAFWR